MARPQIRRAQRYEPGCLARSVATLSGREGNQSLIFFAIEQRAGCRVVRTVSRRAKKYPCADAVLIDLLFAANGQTYESLQDHVRTLTVNACRFAR